MGHISPMGTDVRECPECSPDARGRRMLGGVVAHTHSPPALPFSCLL